MREYHCNVIIFSSSATVYGCNNEAPYVEEMPTSATNPYGYTKVMIEQILRDVCTANPEFTAVALRYFNPIGAHISGLLGENPNGIPNNLVPYVAQVALGKLDHVRVFGDDYDTPDGTVALNRSIWVPVTAAACWTWCMRMKRHAARRFR